MAKRAPLYADGYHEPDMKQMSKDDEKEVAEQIKRSLIKWSVGWVIFAILLVTLFDASFTINRSLYYTGYALILVGGILAYSSAYGGNYRNTYAAYAGLHKLVTNDILSARQRMFGIWMGPLIGVLIGFSMVINYG